MATQIGIVRDDRYFLHYTGADHPERASRLKSIYRMLDKDFVDKVTFLDPAPATLEQLELVHTPAYINKLLKTSERDYTGLAHDTSASAQSFLSAWLAVGGCTKALKTLASGRLRYCLALIRPPGNHALPDRAGGFCLFNNLAITAKYAIKKYNYSRVLILDWDITHGNGLQDIFYDSDEVLYVSTHYTGWYPYSGEMNETGSGPGLGYTINIPVEKDLEDLEVLYIYWKILPQIMRNFRPDLILIAAGFNGHHRDPLGRTQLTELAFRWLTELLLEQKDDTKRQPMLFALEGGYDSAATVSCVREVLDVLTFEGHRPRLPVSVAPKYIDLVDELFDIHKHYKVWLD